MHHHPRIAQRNQAVGLITVGQKSSRHRLAHQQRNDRMAGQPGAGVAVRRAGQGLVNAERFFASAIGLARYVDDGDQGALLRFLRIGDDDVIHCLGQPPAFEQTDFAVACPDKTVVGIGHHRNEAHRLPAQYAIGDFQRRWQAFNSVRPCTQGVEPVQTPQGIRTHGRSPWYRWRTVAGSICGSASRRASRCRNRSA